MKSKWCVLQTKDWSITVLPRANKMRERFEGRATGYAKREDRLPGTECRQSSDTRSSRRIRGAGQAFRQAEIAGVNRRTIRNGEISRASTMTNYGDTSRGTLARWTFASKSRSRRWKAICNVSCIDSYWYNIVGGGLFRKHHCENIKNIIIRMKLFHLSFSLSMKFNPRRSWKEFTA